MGDTVHTILEFLSHYQDEHSTYGPEDLLTRGFKHVGPFPPADDFIHDIEGELDILNKVRFLFTDDQENRGLIEEWKHEMIGTIRRAFNYGIDDAYPFYIYLDCIQFFTPIKATWCVPEQYQYERTISVIYNPSRKPNPRKPGPKREYDEWSKIFTDILD
jgi:hypothetical protein